MASSSDEELDEVIIALNAPQQQRQPRLILDRRMFEITNQREFREKFRVPQVVLRELIDSLGPRLVHVTKRNKALSPEQQIKVFLHFLGTN